MTYHMPALPEPGEAGSIGQALEALDLVLAALSNFRKGQPTQTIDLTEINAESRRFLDEVLGEGEVRVIGGRVMQAQESVLAGVWRVRTTSDDGWLSRDLFEVGHLPSHVNEIAFADASAGVRSPDGAPADGLLASPSLLAELHQKLTEAGDNPHAINLSLLPHTEEDLTFLDRHLGRVGPYSVAWLRRLPHLQHYDA